MLDQLHAAELLYRNEVREREQRIAIRRSIEERTAHLASAEAPLAPSVRPARVRVAPPAPAPHRDAVRPAWPRHITARSTATREPVLAAGGSLGAAAAMAHACS